MKSEFAVQPGQKYNGRALIPVEFDGVGIVSGQNRYRIGKAYTHLSPTDVTRKSRHEDVLTLL